jgi:hypothetical protein
MVCAQVRIEIEPTTPHSGDINFLPNITRTTSQLHFYQATPMIAREIGLRRAADDRSDTRSASSNPFVTTSNNKWLVPFRQGANNRS